MTFRIGFPVLRRDGRLDGSTVTWLPNFLGCINNQILLPMVLRCARFAVWRALLQIKLRRNVFCHINLWVFIDNNHEFSFRAAQKLMSSKKKQKKGHTHKQEASPHYPSPSVELIPSRHGQKEVQPYPFPTKFKEVLRVSSPAVPPGLLKLHTKRTDGKVGFTSVNVLTPKKA